MQEFFLSGHVVDLVLCVVAFEIAAVWAYRRATGAGVKTSDLLANLASGVCLLLALRAALTHQPWIWVAGALLAALVAHLFDLSRRWVYPSRLRADVHDRS